MTDDVFGGYIMTAQQLKTRKEAMVKDVQDLKEDIEVLKEIITYIEGEMDKITLENVHAFDDNVFKYQNRLKIVSLG